MSTDAATDDDRDIDVVDESGEDVDVVDFTRLARFVLERMRIHPQAELSLKFVDVDEMANLDKFWMESEGPTDVLCRP